MAEELAGDLTETDRDLARALHDFLNEDEDGGYRLSLALGRLLAIPEGKDAEPEASAKAPEIPAKAVETPPKKRGRPPGSKNKPKAPAELAVPATEAPVENAPPPDVGADNMKAQIAALDDGLDIPESLRRTS